MTRRIRREEGEREAPLQTPGPAPQQAPAARITTLQRGAGNAAVSAYLARQTATEATPLDHLRELLDDGDEEGAIGAMGALSTDDARTAVGDVSLRTLAVSTFDDEEMARAMTSLRGGTLVQKLNWMSAEGSSLGLVWPLIVDTATPATEKTAVYAHNYLRDFFVGMCDNEEMASVVRVLGGTLEQKLNWMLVEGSEWPVVRALLADTTIPADQKSALYPKTYMRDMFVELLDDEQMAEAVVLLGGTLTHKLNWMIAEGTNDALAIPIIGNAPTGDLYIGTPLPDWLDEGLRSELSGAGYERALRMLTSEFLNSAEIDESRTESHYELIDENDASLGYELRDFLVEGKYQIVYTRSELRVKVRIGFTGVAAQPAHLAIWQNGIDAKWNNKFHLENGHRLAVVFEPVWNSSDEHHEIELHLPPVVREDAANWYAGPNANPNAGTGANAQDTTDADTAAHEFGHLIGLADEYNLTAADYEKFTGAAPAGAMPAAGYDTTSVMAVISGPAEGRHIAPFVAWLNANRIPGQPAYRLVGGP